MVKWFDVNLNWADVNRLRVEIAKSGGERFILLNGYKHTRQSLKKGKPDNMQGSRMHLFGLDFVIKVDSPFLYRMNGMDTGRKQSNAEHEIWESLDTRDRKYFAEVLAYEKNKYIVFRRYPEIDDMNPPKQKILNKYKRKVEALCDKYEISDVSVDTWNGLDETHNWCMVNGQPLIFDYGYADIFGS